MRKKKIASFFESISYGGGVELVQASMSLEFINKGYSFTHVLLDDKSDRIPHSGKIINLNRKFIFGFGFKKILELFIVGKKISKISKNNNIDVFLGHGDFFYMTLCISKIFFNNNSKIVGVLHSTLSYWPTFIQYILVYFLKKCDLIIVLSHEELSYLTSFNIPKNKIQIIPNGIDIPKIIDGETKSSTKNIEKFNNKKFTFINIGRLTEQKNHKFLIDCFNNFYKEEKNIQLIILGEGELRKELENYKETLDCGSSVYLLGNKNDVYKYLKLSHCLFLSSIYEGFGMVLLESMINGLPIISTRCPSGPREILQGKFKSGIETTSNAILIDVYSVEQGTIAMKKMYGSSDLRQQIIKNNLKYVDKYSIENSVIKWIKQIEKL